jgi:nucleoside-diphosphate-sugar epimerase
MRRAALNGEDFEMSAGEQLRDFIPVEEVASKLLLATTDSAQSCGAAKIVNLGSGRAQTLREFAELWWHKWNAPGQLKIGAVPYRKNEVMSFIPQVPN